MSADDAVIGEMLSNLRQPPEPPIDEMWSNIELRAFPALRILPIRTRQSHHWQAPAIAAAAAAAALMVGTAIGWSIAPRAPVVGTTTVASRPSVAASEPTTAAQPAAALAATERATPDARSRAGVPEPRAALASRRNAMDVEEIDGSSEMSRYLYRTAALLASLPSAHAGSAADTAIATRASDLLTQTHLLLDSPAGSEPTLHRLLEDLELVLAQVAHLRARGNGTDLQLIHEALTVHDVLPRVHDATLEASTTD